MPLCGTRKLFCSTVIRPLEIPPPISAARLEAGPPFQLMILTGWRTKFSTLKYHVRHVGLPQRVTGGSYGIFNSADLVAQRGAWSVAWEIYIIEGVNNVEVYPTYSFAVLIRFHHAYVDGKVRPRAEYGR